MFFFENEGYAHIPGLNKEKIWENDGTILGNYSVWGTLFLVAQDSTTVPDNGS